jgi:RimJ/RimL family protein N-acetyltransferase
MNYWQGEKIRLRGIEPGDAPHFYRWNLDSERARMLHFVWPPSSEASVVDWAETQSKQKFENDSFHWVIENRAGEPVGSISTHRCNPRSGMFMYGIDIAAEHRRQGYAAEAIRLVLKYYFEELRYQKVNVTVSSQNEASIRLHQSLGFQEEGRLRRVLYTQGQYVDEFWFGMTAEEFQEQLLENRQGSS